MLSNIGQCSQIHTHTGKYRQIPTNTCNTFHYLPIPTNSDQYIPYIPIHTIQYRPRKMDIHQYNSIHTNMYITYHFFIHANTNPYL